MASVAKVLLVGVICVFRFVVTFEGESCSEGDKNGVCTQLMSCQSALADVRKGLKPKLCGFDGPTPILCCFDASKSPQPATTMPTTSTTTTTESTPPMYDYEDPEESCPPLSTNLTSKKTGKKAWDKCIEYQESLIYPCEKSVSLAGGKTRGKYCYHNVDDLIIGGVDARYAEFPHMALLGFGDTPERASWLCGGTLISDKFVVTAGHCTSQRDLGAISFVRLSLLKRTDPIVSTTKRVYSVSRIIKHPDYKPPAKYNDIALLETSTRMLLDQFAVPACIHTGGDVDIEKAVATGWGAEQYRGSQANIMQKVTINKFSTIECMAKFPPERLMKQGFQEATQMCYGDKTMSKDTCQGDSGGPLQVKNHNIHCMYTIIGITSFGRACGFVGEPGIYTRIEAFAPWIESVVWP